MIFCYTVKSSWIRFQPPTCASVSQTVTRPVWAVWVVDLHAAESVLPGTDWQASSVSVITSMWPATVILWWHYNSQFYCLCSDVDECSDRVLACHGLDEICTNTAGSFRCDCAEGFSHEDDVCVKQQKPSESYHTHTCWCLHLHPASLQPLTHLSAHADVEEKGLFEDMRDDEVEVLRQMFFGVVLCALGTLAAKGDFVYTSVFMGALAAMAGYWLSDRGDLLLDSFLKGRWSSFPVADFEAC